MTIRKRDRTRERLLTAAQELLLEGGFTMLGIQPLTERADVALGTIYNYFRTREEVADAVVEILISAFLRSMERITHGLTDPAEIMAASIRQTLFWMKPGNTFGRMLFLSGLPMTRYVYQTRQGFTRDMKEGIVAGRFTVAQEPVISSMIAGGVLAVLMDLFLGQVESEVIEQVAEQALMMLGLPPEEAQRIARLPLDLKDAPDFPLSAIEYLPPLEAA
ncbi:MAG: TetR/AcrR family transcriptional regulator [Fluviicoccus sp.]|uniref:TetR/AcrR family transcriptional regulator n=1 Tax=Fluviicoccus sp. TaxID=2003552 RepID=UPI0027219D9B|nr:TetR/AcrR family transcriptional regulator [Fluviicoccus sp.]MDO8330625.1 TetR/AcrR family transcriptional regulator [Fluviicoccus sp.]